MSNDLHAGGGRSQELLYDANVPTPSHAEQARTLAARVTTAALCTVAVEPAGFPYGSFVTFGLDGGSPVFLISELAEHTKNLRADGRASLLVDNENQEVAAGSLVFVPANVEHRFHSISENLTVLVFFAPAEYSRTIRVEEAQA